LGKLIQGANDLQTVNPKLANEWDYKKNENLTPNDITSGSNKNVWWICEKGHSYSAKIKSRNKGNACPYCSGHRVLTGFNDLATTNPLLLQEWDYEKNGDLLPTDITAGSLKRIWWICKRNHSYETGLADRTIGKHGCPYCSGRKPIIGTNDLATTNPELLKEWDYEKNGDLAPTDVMVKSGKKVWWICDKGHSYSTRISHKTDGHGCPYCANQKVLSGYNDLATTNFEITKEWDYKKNNFLKPTDVMAKSSKKVWWTCDKGHSYFARISHKTNGQGCPICNNTSKMNQFLRRFFSSQNIKFVSEYKFDNCRNIKPLPFDIYLCDFNILIEADGIQHFETNIYFDKSNSLEYRQNNDSIKNTFCKDNNIPLLRIPYIYDVVKDKDKIEKFINDFIQTKEIPLEISDFYKNIPFSTYVT